MIENATGSQNGINVEFFKKGQVYNIVDELATVFIEQMKVAKKVLLEQPTIEKPKEVLKKEKPKMEKPVYENKAVRGKSK